MGEVVLAPFFLEDRKGEDLWPWVSRQSSRESVREREREGHFVNWITSLSSLSSNRLVRPLPFLPP